ncbi:Phosphotransferase enzyme family [Teratosphaeria destructans]|uniref:Phosphotransferase enzyme family n=1 Tax=Teratosphaeria destructans TaxID=418781 RepID=A0A9W7SLC4_9PEZI|nr:Phosphotransferase enzyme family [Teratosphaeria destructans]
MTVEASMVVSSDMSLYKEDALLPSFFHRNGLSRADVDACHDFAATVFPRYTIEAAREQGGCSYTLVASGTRHEPAIRNTETMGPYRTIVQFRLLKHAVDMEMVEAARQASHAAPETWSLGVVEVADGSVALQAVAMTCLPGRRFSDVQPRCDVLSSKDLSRMKVLLESLSGFLAEGWKSGLGGRTGMECCGGRVGKSLCFRLEKLARDLPTNELRRSASQVVTAVRGGALDGLPIVLTHGDLLPSNILVGPASWRIRGVIDWAEAEWLPFGICLYGLEHLLGCMETAVGSRPKFVYYRQAKELRDGFWGLLLEQIPELENPELLAQVMLARDVGVCLWRGFAWDDGAIDRVVNVDDDEEEVAFLEAFLGLRSTAAWHDSMIDSQL